MPDWIGDQMAGVGPEATRVFGRNAQTAVIPGWGGELVKSTHPSFALSAKRADIGGKEKIRFRAAKVNLERHSSWKFVIVRKPARRVERAPIPARAGRRRCANDSRRKWP
jgi:hypothetical protein